MKIILLTLFIFFTALHSKSQTLMSDYFSKVSSISLEEVSDISLSYITEIEKRSRLDIRSNMVVDHYSNSIYIGKMKNVFAGTDEKISFAYNEKTNHFMVFTYNDYGQENISFNSESVSRIYVFDSMFKLNTVYTFVNGKIDDIMIVKSYDNQLKYKDADRQHYKVLSDLAHVTIQDLINGSLEMDRLAKNDLSTWDNLSCGNVYLKSIDKRCNN